MRTIPFEVNHRLPTPEEVRRRRRGKRLAAILRRYGPEVREALLEILGEDLGRLLAEVLKAQRVHQAGQGGGQ